MGNVGRVVFQNNIRGYIYIIYAFRISQKSRAINDVIHSRRKEPGTAKFNLLIFVR